MPFLLLFFFILKVLYHAFIETLLILQPFIFPPLLILIPLFQKVEFVVTFYFGHWSYAFIELFLLLIFFIFFFQRNLIQFLSIGSLFLMFLLHILYEFLKILYFLCGSLFVLFELFLILLFSLDQCFLILLPNLKIKLEEPARLIPNCFKI